MMDDDILNSSSNPQPPPLTEEEKEILEGDKIGDTAYSKKWVLSVLFHMVNDLKKDSDNDDVQGSAGSGNESQEDSIDPTLEQELCELWDMTMDSDVSKYLLDEDGIDLILEVILRTKSVRKLEIGLGILANMACTPEVCKAIVDHPTLSDVTLFHIDNPDVRTLIELSRLISVCLSNKESRKDWIEVLQKGSITEKLVFILENSLNVELLDVVTEIVDKLIDSDDQILEELSTEKMVTVICDVYRRTAVKYPQTVQNLLHTLQLISTTEKGVSSLASVKESGEIAQIILIEASKYFTPLESNFPSLVSSCCILNVLMSADKEKAETFTKKDFKMLLTVLSLTEELSDKITHYKKEDPDTKQDDLEVYKKYFDAVVDFLFILIVRFDTAKIKDGMLDRLKDRGTQISRVISLLKTIPEHSSHIEKFADLLQKLGVLRGKATKDIDNPNKKDEKKDEKVQTKT